ncbi:MAG: hypothetical protein IJT36_08500 [Alphaproteobacteria bacterium]|nr:hypothetical protein [Alphaproteobacteria bacterium]
MYVWGGVRISFRRRPSWINYIYFKFIADWYKIIPLGTYCLPRVITTQLFFKPTKSLGEETFPFDLAFFNDLDVVAKLIENRFENFFYGLEFKKNQDGTGIYINKKLKAVFNHDGNLTKDEFVNRYNRRIDYFYKYIKDKKKKIFFIIATYSHLNERTIDHIIEAIEIYRKDKYQLIIINQNKDNLISNRKNVSVIEAYHLRKEFDLLNTNGQWVAELSTLEMKEAKVFHEYMKKEFKTLIKKND